MLTDMLFVWTQQIQLQYQRQMQMTMQQQLRAQQALMQAQLRAAQAQVQQYQEQVGSAAIGHVRQSSSLRYLHLLRTCAVICTRLHCPV